jgi:hypothetical protein
MRPDVACDSEVLSVKILKVIVVSCSPRQIC